MRIKFDEYSKIYEFLFKTSIWRNKQLFGGQDRQCGASRKFFFGKY